MLNFLPHRPPPLANDLEIRDIQTDNFVIFISVPQFGYTWPADDDDDGQICLVHRHKPSHQTEQQEEEEEEER